MSKISNGWGSGKPLGKVSPGNGWGAPKQKLFFAFGTGKIFESSKSPEEKFQTGLSGGLLSIKKPTLAASSQQTQSTESIESDEKNEFQKIENNGEENDTILVNFRCVFKQFDTKNKQWIDRGGGKFHLNVAKDNGVPRMIIRREPLDAISVNARLDKMMKPELHKKGITFTVFEEQKTKDEVKYVPKKSYVIFEDEAKAKEAFQKFDELIKKL